MFEIVGEEDGVGDLVNEDVLDDDEVALEVDVDLGEVCVVTFVMKNKRRRRK